MIPLLTQSLLLLTASVLIASIVGSLIYLLFRLLENKSPISAQVVSRFIFFAPLLNTITFDSEPRDSLNFYFIAIFIGLIGSILHQRSSDKPRKIVHCFFLMDAVALLTMLASMTIFETSNSLNQMIRSTEKQFGLSIWFLVTAQSIAAPFFICAWKSSRLRPGMDKHLES